MTADATLAPPCLDASLDVAAVYAREFDYVWRTLRRLGVPSRNLPDVTHDVFVVVHRRAPDYDASRPMRPWLFGIALRVARDHMALGRNRNESVGDPMDVADPTPDPEQRLADAQSRALVLAALQALELEHRAVFILHDLEERPMSVVSEALDVPAKTLYARLKVARARFTAAVRRLQTSRKDRP